MIRTVLHLLSQRPSHTGSGITLTSMVRQAHQAGWQQHVVVGTPAQEPFPRIDPLPDGLIHPLVFGAQDTGFDLPGMSDVMPYDSSRFACLKPGQVADYRNRFRQHIARVVTRVRPDIIHTHHVWLMSAQVKSLAPGLPVVVHCHATGLRQLELCPHLADEVLTGCRACDGFVVLHQGHAAALQSLLNIPAQRIHVVGAGYRQDLFHHRSRKADDRNLLYVGKYSPAKGLPWLLDAIERLSGRFDSLRLHVAGDGSGPEADDLRRRMQTMAPRVVLHGQLSQDELANLMRSCAICVLPSFYEGMPLVLVEALACGCRLVSTRLPGVMEQLVPRMGDALETVTMPDMIAVDQPRAEGLPVFVEQLAEAIARSLGKGPLSIAEDRLARVLEPFTFNAVFERIERVWTSLLRRGG